MCLRPLFVKLDSVWDRRLLLASKSKLKQFRVDRLFLCEDLPPDVRHRRFSPRSDSGPSSFPSTSPNTVSLPCDSDSSPVDHDSARDLTHNVKFNCRGWNSGLCVLPDLLDTCDICFIQEHWLFTEHLSDLNSVNNEFTSFGVSGMDSGILLCGTSLWWLRDSLP